MDFSHSDVLFCGDDGLALEFNIQNTVEKDSLKAMIEHGSGMCTHSDNAIYLVSPGTKVINVGSDKRLILSTYILDCVRQNLLLDPNEYRVEINEMETSDFSDNSANLIGNETGQKDSIKSSSDNVVDNSIDKFDPNIVLSSNLVCASSNHAFDFEDNLNLSNIVLANKEILPGGFKLTIPLQSDETHIKIDEMSRNVVSDSLDLDESMVLEDVVRDQMCENGENVVRDQMCENGENVVLQNENIDAVTNLRNSPISAVIVSSSQPNEGDADEFDNDILSKITERPPERNDDCLSQSYTVSSSADAQVSPKLPSHHNTSAEIFDGSSVAPDSASQTTERQQYIRNLEKEIEQILQKPSPKSIQDKIALVKYICCVKKLPPAKVLQTLQNLTKCPPALSN